MPIEPVYEKINVNNRKNYFSEQIKCKAKTSVATSEIKEILSINSTAGVFGSEITNGQISFSGKAVFYVCYLDQGGQVRKTEVSSDFSSYIKEDSVKEGYKAIFSVELGKTEFDISGIALEVGTSLAVQVQTAESVELSALAGGEGLICDNVDIQVVKSFGVKEGVYPIEEEFELDTEIKEVLSHRANAVITQVQCGVGSIIVDGKAFLTVIALQNQEKCAIIKETRVVPFRTEIECEDAMPTMRATAKVFEKSLKTQVEVDEDSQKSVVSISLNLCFSAEAFIDQTITVCKDVFSTTENLNLEKDNAICFRCLDPVYACTKINGRAGTDELPIGVSLFAIGEEKVEIISKQQTDIGLKLTGALSCIGYFSNGEGLAFTRKLEMPFEKVIEVALAQENAELDLIIKAENGTARLVNAVEVELDVELNLTLYQTEKSEFSCIKEVISVGEKVENPHAISVYIPVQNEELWSLSKRLNVCPETLLSTNPELCFPLTGNERIVVYRQR